MPVFEYKGDKTWSEVKIGEIVKHQFGGNLLLKTSKNKYFDITNNIGCMYPPYLQEGHDKYKLYYSITNIQSLTASAEDNI